MPWTLYRYILQDVVKVLALATGVLVVLIAFAMAIKPLADGLLGPLMLIKFVAVMMPPALGFALPFAGAFASTIVFTRLAADNEITAAAASGISYLRLLLPIMALGLVLTLGLFTLANTLTPAFYRYAAATVQQDLITTMVGRLNQNRPFVFEDHGLVIYADQARLEPPPRLPEAKVQPSRLVELDGTAAAKLGGNGAIEAEATARSASVLWFPGADRSWAMVRLRDVLGYQTRQQEFTRFADEDVDLRLPVRQPFKDDPEYLSYTELNQLRRRPQRYDRVNNQMHTLAQALAQVKLRQRIAATLQGRRSVPSLSLKGPREGERYAIRAPVVRRKGGTMRLLAQPDQPIQVAYRENGSLQRRYEATEGVLRITSDAASGDSPTRAGTLGLGVGKGLQPPRVNLTLKQVRIYDPELGGDASQKQRFALPAMTWPGPIFTDAEMTLAQPRSLSVAGLKHLAGQPLYRDQRPVRRASRLLNQRLLNLGHEIEAQLHSRAASAVSCLLLLVLGAVLSMHLRGQMTLVIYLWSFLPAIFTLIIINSGEKMAGSAEQPLAMALSILWAGNLALAAVAGIVYCRLARH